MNHQRQEAAAAAAAAVEVLVHCTFLPHPAPDSALRLGMLPLDDRSSLRLAVGVVDRSNHCLEEPLPSVEKAVAGLGEVAA